MEHLQNYIYYIIFQYISVKLYWNYYHEDRFNQADEEARLRQLEEFLWLHGSVRCKFGWQKLVWRWELEDFKLGLMNWWTERYHDISNMYCIHCFFFPGFRWPAPEWIFCCQTWPHEALSRGLPCRSNEPRHFTKSGQKDQESKKEIGTSTCTALAVVATTFFCDFQTQTIPDDPMVIGFENGISSLQDAQFRINSQEIPAHLLDEALLADDDAESLGSIVDSVMSTADVCYLFFWGRDCGILEASTSSGRYHLPLSRDGTVLHRDLCMVYQLQHFLLTLQPPRISR